VVTTWITPKARKGVPSEIAGRGLVAVRPIEAGEVVAVKAGQIVTTEELHRLPEPLPDSSVQITDDLHLCAVNPDEYDSVMLFLNHSCDPNVGFGGNVVLVAMRAVRPGEELTTDYALFDDGTGAAPTSRRGTAGSSPGTCSGGSASRPRADLSGRSSVGRDDPRPVRPASASHIRGCGRIRWSRPRMLLYARHHAVHEDSRRRRFPRRQR
jgi:hypothetical protein